MSGAEIKIGANSCGYFPSTINASEWLIVKCGVDGAGASGDTISITSETGKSVNPCGLIVYGYVNTIPIVPSDPAVAP